MAHAFLSPLRAGGRAARAGEASAATLPEALRRDLLTRYGSFAIAYSVAMQPGLFHFGDERGFLSFTTVGKTAFVLADPIAEPDRWESLIDSFVREMKDVGFWQTSRRTAEILAKRGFFVNEFGTMTTLDLQTYSFAGPKRRSFRTARNRVEASESEIREVPLKEIDPARLQAISNGWRQTKVTGSRELRFLVRPIALTDEPGVRKFFLLDRERQPVAFAFFDPVYAEGRVVGYLSATRRWLPTADPLSAYALVGAAIERFQAEGVGELHLGVSPFHRIKDGDLGKNWLAKRAFRFLYTNSLANRFVYPAQSLARHKESYGGRIEKTYYAFNTLPSLPRLLKVLRACRIL